MSNNERKPLSPMNGLILVSFVALTTYGTIYNMERASSPSYDPNLDHPNNILPIEAFYTSEDDHSETNNLENLAINK